MIPAGLDKIALLVLDVDGVLTDGGITYSDSGAQIKTFNVKDGLGLRLLMDAGVAVAVITGRSSKALGLRCEDLGITHLFQGVKDKLPVLQTLLDTTGNLPDATAFMGDDLPDLAVTAAVGHFFTVADAPFELSCRADYITTAPGGHGAVREVCELILKARGTWPEIVRRFLP